MCSKPLLGSKALPESKAGTMDEFRRMMSDEISQPGIGWANGFIIYPR